MGGLTRTSLWVIGASFVRFKIVLLTASVPWSYGSSGWGGRGGGCFLMASPFRSSCASIGKGREKTGYISDFFGGDCFNVLINELFADQYFQS